MTLDKGEFQFLTREEEGRIARDRHLGEAVRARLKAALAKALK